MLTSVATPALTRTDDRREPARGRAAEAAGADERRRAAAAEGLCFVDRRKESRYFSLGSQRPTKRERERPFSSKRQSQWWSCCLDRVPPLRSTFLARLDAFSSHRRGLAWSQCTLCSVPGGESRRRALKRYSEPDAFPSLSHFTSERRCPSTKRKLKKRSLCLSPLCGQGGPRRLRLRRRLAAHGGARALRRRRRRQHRGEEEGLRSENKKGIDERSKRRVAPALVSLLHFFFFLPLSLCVRCFCLLFFVFFL